MSINPLVFANNVAEEFRRYLLSAFPMADPELAEQARAFLSSATPLDMPLIKGPYVTLSEAFAAGDPIADMASKGVLHPVMPGLIGYFKMYRHQQEVFEAVKANKHVLISTGTGSGKTEAFLYPIIDDLLRQRDQSVLKGLTAILIYPMNALANDQLERLRVMLAGTGITFGQWIGSTPRSGRSPLVDRFEGSSRAAFLDERKKRLDEARQRDKAARALAPEEECLSEEEIRERMPRILITNYRQLEILLTRLPDVKLFARSPLKYLVFDEAHTYDGAAGAEVACLIRRLRLLANKAAEEVICIGTSATLTDPDKKDDGQAAIRFASRFFGVDEKTVKLVGESYVQREWPKNRYKPEPPQGDGTERLGRLLTALNEPIDVSALKTEVESLTGTSFNPGDDWRGSLFDHLVSNEYVFQCAQILKRPQELAEGAWIVSNAVKHNRCLAGEATTAELLAYLTLGAAAGRAGESLLRPKVHFFVRGLDEMVVAADGDGVTTSLQLFPSQSKAKDTLPLVHDDGLFPVAVCRECGQHFFERNYGKLKIIEGSGHRVSLTSGNLQETTTGESSAWWAADPSGTRLVMTNRLLDEVDEDEESTAAKKFMTAFVCRVCGALHVTGGSRCLAEGCGHDKPLLPVLVLGGQLSSCPTCGALSRKIGGRMLEPARKVRAVAVADVHVLAQAMINSAPKGHQKLVIFADSRQDAAFQAGWIQDHGRRIRLRHMMYEIMRSADRSLSLDELTDELQASFKRQRRLVEVLLPEMVEEFADQTFEQRNLWIRVGRALEYMVLREFTSGLRKREILEAMGLARVDYEGLTPEQSDVVQWANIVGITPTEAVQGVSLILDTWRRGRMLYVDRDPVFSHYHKKDDPWVQAGLLPVREFKPEGMVLTPRSPNGRRAKYWRSMTNSRGNSLVQLLLKAWSSNSQSLDLNLATESLWELLTNKLGIVETVDIRTANGDVIEHDVGQIDSSKVRIAVQEERHRCKKCQRISTRSAPGNVCMRRYCGGTTVREEPSWEDYNTSVMRRPFTMVNAEEHTAQVPSEVRNKVEQDFKSPQGRTNCLVATPTLELGVDIGGLDMVLMRNVPPQPNNYWQRAGRAGRQERMAVITTHCRHANHDRYFFEDPLRLLGGSIAAPAFNLRNPLMLEKHVRAAVLSELLLQSQDGTDIAEHIEKVLNEAFPLFIREYLLDDEDHFRTAVPSMDKLGESIDRQKSSLVEKIHGLFLAHWPRDEAASITKQSIEQALVRLPDELQLVLERLHDRLGWARKTREEIQRRQRIGLIEKEEEQLLRRCDDFVKSVVKRDNSTYTLIVLSSEGFLPGYGIYEGGIVASALSGFARRSGPVRFELSRPRAVALREFVAGNRLYANRGTFYVTRYHFAPEAEGGITTLHVDPKKQYVARAGATVDYGQSGLKAVSAIPISDLDLAHEGRITEDEVLRFAMPVLIAGRLLDHHRGGRAFKIGKYEVHHLRGQGIELVNLGEAGKVGSGELGFHICQICGAAKSPYVVDKEKERFDAHHQERCGREPMQLALTTKTDVDALLFHKLSGLPEGINIGETLRTAAARIMDMGRGDLELLPIPDEHEMVNFLIYDPMVGGSGILDQMLSRWDELMTAAADVLDCKASCDQACYSCLLTYRNQVYHEYLDRTVANALLEELRNQPEPYRTIDAIFEESGAGTGTPSNRPEAELAQILREHHIPAGKLRETVRLADGMISIPDWLYVDPNNSDIKVAVYLDGMSRSLHGDPQQQIKDQALRGLMEAFGYKVIVVQSRDLTDPEIMRQHILTISKAIDRG